MRDLSCVATDKHMCVCVYYIWLSLCKEWHMCAGSCIHFRDIQCRAQTGFHKLRDLRKANVVLVCEM